MWTGPTKFWTYILKFTKDSDDPVGIIVKDKVTSDSDKLPNCLLSILNQFTIHIEYKYI